MNWEKSAVVVIDMQNDFCLPDAVMPVEGAMDVAPVVAEILETARKYKMPIVHIVRLYKTDGSNADLCRKEMILSGIHVVEPDTEGAEILEILKPLSFRNCKMNGDELLNGHELKIEENEYILYKSRWGAFYKTKLEDLLREQGIDSLIIMGINFPNCPRATIYQASERDFKICVVKEGMSRLDKKGIDELKNIGVHVFSKKEVICQLNNKKYAQNLV